MSKKMKTGSTPDPDNANREPDHHQVPGDPMSGENVSVHTPAFEPVTTPTKQDEENPWSDLVPTWTLNGAKRYRFDEPDSYLLVGCDLYYRATVCDARGHAHEKLVPWRFSQLKRDFRATPEAIDNIPRYIGLGSFPSHTDYQQDVNGVYNTYARIDWQPTPGEWPHIHMLFQHIFSEHYEFGLDYVQMLYLYPRQMLPILVLVSKARETGKTTFLNFMKAVFGSNMAFVTNETLRSRFNGERASRLIVACDEAFLNKKEDSERLKALSTAETTYIEFKGKDRYEVDNYAKIILCSNNVCDPVYIDAEERRYWVREVPTLKDKQPEMLVAMKKEIPAFLDFLRHRQLSVPQPMGRMWFDTDLLRTPALERIVRKCRPTPELELAEFLLDEMDAYSVDTLQYTSSDMAALLKVRNREIRDHHRIICKAWDIPHAPNKDAYLIYAPWVERPPQRAYGRFYTFTRTFLGGLIPDYTTAGLANAPREGEGSSDTLFSG